MDNLLDIYTRLKLKIGSEIIVTYYSSDGFKHTKEFILLEINEFSYIYVGNNLELMSLPFFSNNTIIESITLKGQNTPIYFNPYISKIDNPFINYEQIKEKINSYLISNKPSLNERKKSISKYLAKYEIVKYDKLFFSEKQKEEFKIFFDMLVNELSEYAKRNSFDPELKEICSGTTSIIYEIGDKIIKIGKPRRIPTIPYCEFILQPIVNRVFEFDGYPIHIEVTQKVFVLDNKDGYASQSEDERFNEITSSLRKHLYNIGLNSNDLHPGNVGILLNDNKIHFDSIPFDTSTDEVTSIENNNNLRILPKGRYVIIDLDSLEIEEPEKYANYLKSIGYQKEKIKIRKPL